MDEGLFATLKLLNIRMLSVGVAEINDAEICRFRGHLSTIMAKKMIVFHSMKAWRLGGLFFPLTLA
ncbi:hypothetical protein HCH_05936 [Hahella chejuensis KCTC 2396]|uniref:Uncharacterized protein n=1 Tax=Hahella chejuensis (strain KCTC 2396) TaxID=349521 RepID=Q2S9T6_HAHCH|nr:hypothetical protein HCH_05936 [Hahella chejuensis KCTC 2396]